MRNGLNKSRAIFSLTSALLVAPALAAAPEPRLVIPKQIAQFLDRTYRGWKPAAIPADCPHDFAQPPSLVRGDFDGNGQADYGILFDYNRERHTLVFLRRGKRFERHDLSDKIGWADMIYVSPAGTEAPFGPITTIPFQSVTFSYCEKAEIAYVYQHGKFEETHITD